MSELAESTPAEQTPAPQPPARQSNKRRVLIFAIVSVVNVGLLVLLIALLMIVFFTYKSIYEESLLRAVYPQYDQYATHTGRFLPFL